MSKRINFNFSDNLDKNIVIIKGPNLSINNENYEEINVQGRNGSLIVKDGTYKNKILSFELGILSESKQDLLNKIDEIIEWLTKIEDNKLFYDREDRYYIVKHIEFADIENKRYLFGKFTVNFICEPFYYDLNEYPLTLTTHETLFYKGTVPGECNIKIYGSGNIQLTINSETVQINNVNEYVELDSKLLLCLNKDKTSKSRDMIGHFPLLIRGSNTISWTGNVSKIEILPRTAYR